MGPVARERSKSFCLERETFEEGESPSGFCYSLFGISPNGMRNKRHAVRRITFYAPVMLSYLDSKAVL